MSGSFGNTTRALDADRSRGGRVAIAVVALLAAGWLAWMLIARVSVYQTTSKARLEVSPMPSQVGAPIGGRITDVELTVGARVNAGDVLVVLDPGTLPVERARAAAQLEALAPERASLEKEIAAEAKTIDAGDASGRAAVREQLAKGRAADLDVAHAEAELARITALVGKGVSAQVELDQARADLAQKRGAREALGHSTDALSAAERERDSQRRAATAELERQRALLDGRIAMAKSEVARLELELSLHTIRAPIAGVLGSIATLQVGATLAVGTQIASVVPAGELRVVADYDPSAIGWLAPGQHGRLKLDGYPWTRWGTVGATVTRVATEVQGGTLRVELALEPGAQMPLAHGMTGQLDVEVEQIHPATLVIRSLSDRR